MHFWEMTNCNQLWQAQSGISLGFITFFIHLYSLYSVLCTKFFYKKNLNTCHDSTAGYLCNDLNEMNTCCSPRNFYIVNYDAGQMGISPCMTKTSCTGTMTWNVNVLAELLFLVISIVFARFPTISLAVWLPF